MNASGRRVVDEKEHARQEYLTLAANSMTHAYVRLQNHAVLQCLFWAGASFNKSSGTSDIEFSGQQIRFLGRPNLLS